ncbi:TBC domain-containing protein, putative [Eimeria tenella]|uniref:TBC domain-containing protein, putative n=1 Tax=Eimeria tenella TaxID=5802 RepID=U6KM46_EIMTE|nr:TBC domain-containing protein, putative [Eimeria tenella]CDJ37332.1 TBC domain-containing protein, putative [Eimeria tenella]|eukprot:XP_013228170.1 TBC domain-containing protein, putative [Eimeria tenella]
MELNMLQQQRPLPPQPAPVGSCDPVWRRLDEAMELLSQRKAAGAAVAGAAAAGAAAEGAAAGPAAARGFEAAAAPSLSPVSSASTTACRSVASPRGTPPSSSNSSSSSSNSSSSRSSSSRRPFEIRTSERLHVQRTAALLRSLGRERAAEETEEVSAAALAHQRLLLQLASQRQHLQQLARQALARPTQLPESLSHWMADSAQY